MHRNQPRDKEMKPRTGKLTAAEIENIHDVFVEIGGYVNRTARRTGFSKSTVSRYVRKSGWREELLCSDTKQLDQRIAEEGTMNELSFLGKDRRNVIPGENEGHGKGEEQIMSKLVALRELLLEEILGKERVETFYGSSLRILPRTLAEAVKALVDIDKRITEREGTQPDTMLDTYHSILARCARVVEDEPE